MAFRFNLVAFFFTFTFLFVNTVSSFNTESVWRAVSMNTNAEKNTLTVMEATSSSDSLPSCPPGSQNCISTTWTPQKGSNKGAVAKAMMSVLQSYPQEGQAGVDKGGWTITSGDLVKTGNVSLEYKSGIGPFAFLFNGGKPFIDDLQIKILASNQVQLRSSSRIGQSDLGVNKKRLLFLGENAKALGWTVPEPRY
jgi:Protein of unknown function (DUF1499)